MKTIKALAGWFLFLFIGAYICLAFIFGSFDMSKFSQEYRENAIGMVSCIWLMSALIVVITVDKKQS